MMIEPAIVVVRLLQYVGAMILLGSSLFFVYALPKSGPGSAAEMEWARPLLAGAAALLALSSLGGIAAQASLFAGSFRAGLTTEAMGAVVFSMDLGKAAVVRAMAGVGALVLLFVLTPGRTSWLAAAGFGTIAAASLAWLGHGAATEGALHGAHLAADILHALTASVWVGALGGFLLVVNDAIHGRNGLEALYVALRRFSRIGLALVAVLVLSGLVNSWVLIGLDNVGKLPTADYGRLLLGKLALFAGMLVLAALNRNRHTPALAADLTSLQEAASLRPLRRSIALEFVLAFGVLVAVAWFGTLSPPGK